MLRRLIALALMPLLAVAFTISKARADDLTDAMRLPVNACYLAFHENDVKTSIDGVFMPRTGYVCETKTATFTARFSELDGAVGTGTELANICPANVSKCTQEVVPRPLSRTADLVKHDAVDVGELAFEANSVALNDEGRDYANLVRPRLQNAMLGCYRIKPTEDDKVGWWWGGRVAPDGTVAVSVVSTKSPLSACVKAGESKLSLPPPPYSLSYARNGGWPVTLGYPRPKVAKSKHTW